MESELASPHFVDEGLIINASVISIEGKPVIAT
jgi:hypothetical protein